CVGGGVAAGGVGGGEWCPGDLRCGDPVGAEGTPAVVCRVPAEQVPAAAGGHQVVRFGGAGGLGAVVAGVAEADPLPVAGGGGDDRQDRWVDQCSGAGQRQGDRVQRADPVAQPGGKHLFQLGQRADRGFLDS